MSKLSLLGKLSQARKVTGRSYLELLREIVALRYGRGRIGASEYFDQRLYGNHLTPEQKRAFCGYRAQSLLEEILVDTYSEILSLDKLTFHQLMRGYGLPVPHLQAYYVEGLRTTPCPRLNNRDALLKFLLEEAVYPLYMKPSFGAFGRANTLLTGCRDGRVILSGGKEVPLPDFVDSIRDPSGLGWLLQDALQPHEAIRRVCGDKVSGLRIHAFNGRDGVVIHRVVWKINTGKADTDNFLHGSSGNLVADIDVETGQVTRVITGVAFDQREVEFHPATGERLLGFEPPGFHAALDLVRTATPIFHGFIFPGWDIALCQEGPVAMEVNFFGDVDLPQYTGRGFFDDELLRLLRERGLEPYLSMPADADHVTATGRRGRRRGHWKY